VHTQFVELNPYHNVVTGFSNPLVVVLYLVAMAVLGLHLYHGIWSRRPHARRQHAIARGRSSGKLALALAIAIWARVQCDPDSPCTQASCGNRTGNRSNNAMELRSNTPAGRSSRNGTATGSR